MGGAVRDDLTAIYRAAVAAVDPGHLVRSRIARHGRDLQISLAPGRTLVRRADRVWVGGAGKAAVAMAAAVATLAPEVAGLVVAPRAATGNVRRRAQRGRIRVLSGDHPVPGAASFRATARLLRAILALPPDVTVLFLLSGGASALLAAPAPGVTRRDKIDLTRHLLRCGAPIDVMNAVRKHLSVVKGGGLSLLARPREVLTLALSDVPGDGLATIGSGPTVGDPTTFATALRVLRATDPNCDGVPSRIWRRLEAGAAGALDETPKPGDARLRRSAAAVIGNNAVALAAAAREARRRGYAVRGRSLRLHGEAAASARRIAGLLPAAEAAPVCLLGGGETFVTAAASAGRGGRCQEFALAAATEIGGRRWSLLCAGTDGIDGQTDAAGAFCDGSTLRRGGRGDAARALREHDSYSYFAAIGDVFRPGPTGTNVMDILIALHPGAGSRAGRGAVPR